MNKRQSKTRFCDGSVQPDVLLDPGTRCAWPGWSLEHRLFAELVRTGQTLSSTYTSPAREKAGNATNLFHEEKRILVLSSCHWGSSFRKPELRKQSMLIGMCENFPLCGRGIKLLLESPFFIFEALQTEPRSKLRLSISKAFRPQWKLSVFPSSTTRRNRPLFPFFIEYRKSGSLPALQGLLLGVPWAHYKHSIFVSCLHFYEILKNIWRLRNTIEFSLANIYIDTLINVTSMDIS